MASRVTRHWQVSALLILFALLALGYSLVLPLGEAADETDHFALVRFIAEQGRPPLTLQERIAIGPKGDASPIYHGLVALLTQHVDVSALPQLPDTQQRPERFIPTDGFRANRVFHTEDERFPFRGIVLAWHLARLVSIPLGAATVVGAYLTALAIYPQRCYLAIAAAGLVAFLPRFVINSAVVNDDNLVVPLVTFAVYCLVRVAQGDQRRRTFIALGALLGGAAIAKYHALVLLPEVTLVLAVLAWRATRQSPQPGPSAWRVWSGRWLCTILAFLAVAGWWFLFLELRFNQVGELGWVRGLLAPLGDPVVTSGLGRVSDWQPTASVGYAFTWGDWASLFFRSFWLSYAWLHIFASPGVYYGLLFFSAIAAVGLLTGLRQAISRRSRQLQGAPFWRTELLVLAFHVCVYMAVIVSRYWLKPARETGQGRHIYPALSALAFFFVLGLSCSGAWLGWLRQRLPLGRYIGRLRPPADAWLAVCLCTPLLVLAILTPPVLILPEYLPYLPIQHVRPAEAPVSERLHVTLAPGIILEGYTLPPAPIAAGEAVPVTLYWYAATHQERDYLVAVCLEDEAGQALSCRYGHPVDGRYPMRAWEPGYLIADRVYLPSPSCLPSGRYQLRLTLLPLRLDTASSVPEPADSWSNVRLGQIELQAGAAASPTELELWSGGRRVTGASLELRQLRQGLTLVTHSASSASPYLKRSDGQAGDWQPLAVPAANYRSPDGRLASTHHFVLDPSLAPGPYQLVIDDRQSTLPPLLVMTRFRNFHPPEQVPNPTSAEFNTEVQLLGYQVDLSPRRPDDVVEVNTWWRSLRTMSRHYVVSLYLLDYAANVAGQSDWTLGGHYPNVLWAPGEHVDEVFSLPIYHQAPPGLYRLQLGLYDYQEGGFRFLPITQPDRLEVTQHLELGRLRIADGAESQPPNRPLTVELAGEIRLLGFDLDQARLKPGETLHLVLHWQAIQPPSQDYTVFTQLLGPDGRVWGQQDNQPQSNRYPTTAWPPLEQVIDRYQVPLRPEAPHGEYRLLSGMYQLASGQRLAAFDTSGNRLTDDAIQLTTITVE